MIRSSRIGLAHAMLAVFAIAILIKSAKVQLIDGKGWRAMRVLLHKKFTHLFSSVFSVHELHLQTSLQIVQAFLLFRDHLKLLLVPVLFFVLLMI